MGQLLVRDIDDSLVRKLKQRARAHGVSAEEEHRRILKEKLAQPVKGKPSLMGFLLSEEGEVEPEVHLDLDRSSEPETRNVGI